MDKTVGVRVGCTDCDTAHRGTIVNELTQCLFVVAWDQHMWDDDTFLEMHRYHVASVYSGSVQVLRDQRPNARY